MIKIVLCWWCFVYLLTSSSAESTYSNGRHNSSNGMHHNSSNDGKGYGEQLDSNHGGQHDSTTRRKGPEDTLQRLARQLMLQQFFMEEQVRNNGHSGLKAMRLRQEGTRPYHASSHSDDFTTFSIHDHADFYNTCGMGEVVAVLNGVEFRTRHNDYTLKMKSTTPYVFGEADDIPYPDVPPSVLEQVSVSEQILEMREYFRAWKEQNDTIRDYKPYFKANLCYLEGAWTNMDKKTVDEAFYSERHWYAAESWEEMMQKVRFSSYSGTKENLENWAFLPTTLWDVDENGELVFGQWNYHIFCHPLLNDLPLNRFRPIDDLKTRMSTLSTFDEYVEHRNARFQLNPLDDNEWFDCQTKFGLLDELMSQVPGMDSYGASIHDTALGNGIKKFNASPSDPELNTAYYHRWFTNKDAGALGVNIRHRGFNDENLWVAMNTQHHVLPVKVKSCHYENAERKCSIEEQRWSYAIPLEVIYTTPLQSWNPYNIEYKYSDSTPFGLSVTQNTDGSWRDGSNSLKKAYNGTNSATFYHTPVEFFSGTEIGVDPADTPKNYVHVLGNTGSVHRVRSSGIRTFLPHIPTIGTLRQRYPIAPIYAEGSHLAKELEALKDIVLNPGKYEYMKRNRHSEVPENNSRPVQLWLQSGVSGHQHKVILTQPDLAELGSGRSVSIVSGIANGHSHMLEIIMIRTDPPLYAYTTCDNQEDCFDGHPSVLSDYHR